MSRTHACRGGLMVVGLAALGLGFGSAPASAALSLPVGTYSAEVAFTDGIGGKTVSRETRLNYGGDG